MLFLFLKEGAASKGMSSTEDDFDLTLMGSRPRLSLLEVLCLLAAAAV